MLGTGKHTVNGKEIKVDMYDLKKKLWLTLNSVNNILEGIRFLRRQSLEVMAIST